MTAKSKSCTTNHGRRGIEVLPLPSSNQHRRNCVRRGKAIPHLVELHWRHRKELEPRGDDRSPVPPADRDIAAAHHELGPESLLFVQGRPRIGFVRVAGRLGNDIQFARQVPHSDGSRRIVIVLARQLTFNEVNRGSSTADYPFTVIELRLDAAGGGDGRMSVGAKIKVHKGSDQIEHEDYAAGTVLLKDARSPRVLSAASRDLSSSTSASRSE